MMRKLALRLETVLADGRDEHFDDKIAITFDARFRDTHPGIANRKLLLEAFMKSASLPAASDRP